MNVTNYPSNSKVSKAQANEKKPDASEKVVEPVVTGEVKIRKKSEARKLLDIFIPEDITNVREFIFDDIIIPGLRRTVYDMGISVLDGFFGDFAHRSKTLGGGAKIAYNAISSRLQDPRSVRYDKPVSRVQEYNDIILSSRVDAQRVLDGLNEIIEGYGFASIRDMFELANEPAPWSYNKYGWADISAARIIPIREGYLLKMPKAMPAD